MAKFEIDEFAYAPIYRLPGGDNAPYAVARGRVVGVVGRSCDIDLPFQLGVRRLGSGLLHKDVGVCIVRVGDFVSEQSVMDPVAKSVLNFLRLLLPDDHIKNLELRTLSELQQAFALYVAQYPIWVVVAHGGGAGDLCFTAGATIGGAALGDALATAVQLEHGADAVVQKDFLFLTCNAGLAGFAKGFSLSPICRYLVAPTGALHGAIASQFAQTLFCYHFLEGRTFGVAFNKTAEVVPTATNFRAWHQGKFR